MAIRALLGFETGDLSEYSATSGAIAVERTTVRTGLGSVRTNVAGSTGNGTLSFSAITYPRGVIHLYMPAAPTAAVVISEFQHPNASNSARLRINTNRTVTVINSNSGDVATTANSIATAEWWTLFFAAEVADPGAYELRLYNSTGGLVETLSGTSDFKAATNTTVDKLVLGVLVSNTFDIYWDDVIVDDSAFPVSPNVKIIARQGKTGTPTDDAWTKSSGAAISVCWGGTPFEAGANAISPASGDPLAQVVPITSFDAALEDYFMQDSSGTGDSMGGTATTGQTLQAPGQGWTPPRSASITRIDAFIRKSGTPTDNIQCEIRSGSFTGTLLGSASIAASSLTTDMDVRQFSFSPAVPVTASTKVYIVFERSGSRDTSNFCTVRVNTNNLHSGGGWATRSNNTWGSESSTEDVCLAIYSLDGQNQVRPADTILAGEVYMIAKRSTGSGRTFESRVRYSGGAADDDSITLGTTDAFKVSAMLTGATLPTYTNINNAEIGGEKSGGVAGQAFTIEDCWYVVAFTPVTSLLFAPNPMRAHLVR